MRTYNEDEPVIPQRKRWAGAVRGGGGGANDSWTAGQKEGAGQHGTIHTGRGRVGCTLGLTKTAPCTGTVRWFQTRASGSYHRARCSIMRRIRPAAKAGVAVWAVDVCPEGGTKKKSRNAAHRTEMFEAALCLNVTISDSAHLSQVHLFPGGSLASSATGCTKLIKF